MTAPTVSTQDLSDAVADAALDVRSRVRRGLLEGGRVRVTVTSADTGKHLTVRLACKKRGEDGRFISRARKDGRVGLREADCVFADAADAACSEGVGRFVPSSGEWKVLPSYVDERAPLYEWAAQKVFAWALSDEPEFVQSFEEKASVELASECSFCGKSLTDPQSIERGIGPECFGKHTGSTHV